MRDQIGAPFFIDVKYTLFADSPHEGWRGQRNSAGGGCIVDMGYHMIDMIIWYFGLPDNVHAEFSAKAKVVRKLITYAKSKVKIRYVYLDRGFFNSIKFRNN